MIDPRKMNLLFRERSPGSDDATMTWRHVTLANVRRDLTPHRRRERFDLCDVSTVHCSWVNRLYDFVDTSMKTWEILGQIKRQLGEKTVKVVCSRVTKDGCVEGCNLIGFVLKSRLIRLVLYKLKICRDFWQILFIYLIMSLINH